jgi:hypothetical protein
MRESGERARDVSASERGCMHTSRTLSVFAGRCVWIMTFGVFVVCVRVLVCARAC